VSADHTGMLHSGGRTRRHHRLRGRRLHQALIGLGVVALLGGCAATPDATDPDATAPGAASRERATSRAPGAPGTPFSAPPTTAQVRDPTEPDRDGTFHLSATRASMGGCALYPPDHYMNAVDVDTLEVHPRSATWLRDLGAGTDATLLFPSSRIWAGSRAGTPLNLVDSRVSGFTRVLLNYSYAPKAFRGPYPIPEDPKVQGYPSAQWDKHLLVVDTAECRAYELIQYDPFVVALTGVQSALNGTTYPLDSTEMPVQTTNSPNTPMLGQYVRVDEVRAGEVPHVMAFCSNRISRSFTWPARSSDGQLDGPDSMPMGTWIRLQQRVDPATFPPGARAVVTALQERGAILTDTCAHSFRLMAENSGEWNDADMQQLSRLDTADFEVVDASAMRADSTSYRVR
jgi:hypothetical protein